MPPKDGWIDLRHEQSDADWAVALEVARVWHGKGADSLSHHDDAEPIAGKGADRAHGKGSCDDDEGKGTSKGAGRARGEGSGRARGNGGGSGSMGAGAAPVQGDEHRGLPDEGNLTVASAITGAVSSHVNPVEGQPLESPSPPQDNSVSSIIDALIHVGLVERVSPRRTTRMGEEAREGNNSAVQPRQRSRSRSRPRGAS